MVGDRLARPPGSLHLAVEGDPFVGARSGVGRYLTGLIDATLAHASGLDATIVLPFDEDVMPAVRGWLRDSGARLRTPSYVPWGIVRRASSVGLPIPYQLLSGPQDVFLFTNYRTFTTLGKPRATIIYDLGFLRAPETIEPRYLSRLKTYVQQVVESDTHVVTISYAVERELLERYPSLDGRITVLRPGTTTELTEAVRDEDGWAALGLRPGYVLSVGNVEPRKNQLRLLDAYARLPAEFAHEHPLVVVGPPGWLNRDIEERLAAMTGRVVRLPYQPDGILRLLYERAAAVAFPTLYEGFGLPVLEALALGVPVVCSDLPVLREVAAEAAVYFDPLDVDAIGSSVVAAAREPDPRMVAAGRARAARFSWTETGQEAIQMFRRLARHR